MRPVKVDQPEWTFQQEKYTNRHDKSCLFHVPSIWSGQSSSVLKSIFH